MRLQEQYKKEVAPEMIKKFGYKNVMAVPKIEKIVVNCGFGKMVIGKSANEREKIEEYILGSLSTITAQKAVLREAKKSIASFKLRKGLPIGAKVVLRGERMYDFLAKLIRVVFPRNRDFRGISLESVTKEGNLTFGFKEYTPFPEMKIDKGIFGLEVTVATTAKSKEEGIELLRLTGLPLKK